jgi:hypothetical protein
LLLALAGLLACDSGPIAPAPAEQGMPSPPGGDAMAGGAPRPAADPGLSPPPLHSDDLPGAAPLRRLSRDEFARTLRDLLPLTAEDVAADQLSLRDNEFPAFRTGALITDISEVHALLEIAEEVAHAATVHLSQLLQPACGGVPAGDAAAEDRCAQIFLGAIARRAYRRPLDPPEIVALTDLFAARRAGGSTLSDAIEVTLQAILQSPQLLYHWESELTPVRDGQLVRFGPWEMASRLSYGLWGSMPDQILFDAAALGQLSTPTQIEAQARRLLADPRADTVLRDFHLQWLQLQDLPDVRREQPNFASWATAMLDETAAFAVSVYRSSHPKLGDLFTATRAFVNAPLAPIYGVPAPTLPGLQPVELPAGQRAGILTRAAFLARYASWDTSNPVDRGTAVLRQVLCLDLPPDPPDVPVPSGPPLPRATTRQRFEQHGREPCARACHDLIDPVGFAFEHYDGVGAYRTHENGEAIDSSGTLPLFAGAQHFMDAIEMSRQLVDGAEVRSCMARQWLRYLTGRLDVLGDQAALADARAVFARSDLDLVELIVALTKSRAFSHRTPSAGEVLP